MKSSSILVILGLCVSNLSYAGARPPNPGIPGLEKNQVYDCSFSQGNNHPIDQGSVEAWVEATEQNPKPRFTAAVTLNLYSKVALSEIIDDLPNLLLTDSQAVVASSLITNTWDDPQDSLNPILNLAFSKTQTVISGYHGTPSCFKLELAQTLNTQPMNKDSDDLHVTFKDKFSKINMCDPSAPVQVGELQWTGTCHVQ